MTPTAFPAPKDFWVRQPRDVVEVAGSDAATYLHGQLSQDVASMVDGESRWTFLLQPTGKIDVLARIWRRTAESYVLDTDAGFGEVLRARLARFKIRVQAELTPARWDSIVTRGAPTPGTVVGWGNETTDLLGADLEPPIDVAEGTAADLVAARVDAVWPAMGVEIVPGETIPAETGISAVAVNFTKGCYPGQELVERMDSRGTAAPRRLVALDVASGAQPGDPIVHEGAEVGILTTVAGGRALGYVKRGVELD